MSVEDRWRQIELDASAWRLRWRTRSWERALTSATTISAIATSLRAVFEEALAGAAVGTDVCSSCADADLWGRGGVTEEDEDEDAMPGVGGGVVDVPEGEVAVPEPVQEWLGAGASAGAGAEPWG